MLVDEHANVAARFERPGVLEGRLRTRAISFPMWPARIVTMAFPMPRTGNGRKAEVTSG